MSDEPRIFCDALGCVESHPLVHDALGEPSFGTGRWLGWIYVDLNRPDLFPRPLRFCCVTHALWWMERERITHSHRPEATLLDVALRAPNDELARARMLAEMQDDPDIARSHATELKSQRGGR